LHHPVPQKRLLTSYWMGFKRRTNFRSCENRITLSQRKLPSQLGLFLRQLTFTEVALYRGTEVVGTFEIDQADGAARKTVFSLESVIKG
jgi:hypothetical protein